MGSGFGSWDSLESNEVGESADGLRQLGRPGIADLVAPEADEGVCVVRRHTRVQRTPISTFFAVLLRVYGNTL